MKKYLYPLFIATAMTAVACSDEDKVSDFIEEEAPSGQKEAIAFTVSDMGAAGATPQTRAGFTAATQIVARFESFKSEVGVAPTSGSDKRTTKTVLTAGVEKTGEDDSKYSVVNYAAGSNDNSYIRYWDDAFGRYANISVYAVAVPQSTSPSNNDVTLENLVNWGGESVSSTNNPNWHVDTSDKISNNNIEWIVKTTEQTTTSIDSEDLCYSNNIQQDATLGKDGRYVWNFTEEKYEPQETGNTTHKDGQLRIALKTPADKTSSGKFDKGHLVFNHALTRISITLTQSTENFSGSFAFASGTNITLKKMYVKGTLDIKTGTWSYGEDAVAKGDIAKIAKTSSGTTAAGTYQAQVLPGYVLTDGDKTNVFEFTIDDNTYYITQDNLFDALTYDANGNGTKDTGDGDMVGQTDPITMEQGKHYKFTIVLNKAKIENITATLADWVVVEAAEESMDNSHVEFTFLNPTGTNCTEINFYRLAEELAGGINTTDDYSAVNWSGDYKTEGVATISKMTDKDGNEINKYKTNWYYDNNKTAYHFRTLNNLAANEGATGTETDKNIQNTTDKKSYFTMTADATKKDYHWGAPMATGTDLAYDEDKGFADNIHKGVTSTESDIKIQELHMMSNLEIVLKTSTGDDKVDLSGATIKITNLATSATVDMGTGLITPAAVAADAEQATTAPSSTDYWAADHGTAKDLTKPFTCAVIPQTLTRGTGTDTQYVGITITTSDENQYYVITKLSDIVADSVTSDRNQEEGDKITRWYPNHTYKYTFKITKKGIENITCTVADWVTVVGAGTEIDLES